jgi:hypothetical protein
MMNGLSALYTLQMIPFKTDQGLTGAKQIAVVIRGIQAISAASSQEHTTDSRVQRTSPIPRPSWRHCSWLIR